MKYKVIQGNNIDVLKKYPDNYFDSIVTDPPYGIDFLGKDWDTHTGAVETWEECLRVLKPGGYMLAFSAARTYHRLARNIEDCGFEIRDQIMWLYSSGFPKAQDMGKAIDKRAGKVDKNYIGPCKTENEKINGDTGTGINSFGSGSKCDKCNKTLTREFVINCPENKCAMKYTHQTEAGKKYAGWKTALKPAHEPIVMARKPFKGSCIDNIQEHGTGALNIDGSRIEIDDDLAKWYDKYPERKSKDGVYENYNPEITNKLKIDNAQTIDTSEVNGRYPSNVIGEVKDYQKFFYCPKVNRKERHIGFDKAETTKEMVESVGGYLIGKDGKPSKSGHMAHIPGIGDIQQHGIATEVEKIRKTNGTAPPNKGNNHPTVKPVALMEYLVKLVTPVNGHVLDPFNGSGSTGMAATANGFEYTGIDLDQAYVDISIKRIEAWNEPLETDNEFNQLFDNGEKK